MKNEICNGDDIYLMSDSLGVLLISRVAVEMPCSINSEWRKWFPKLSDIQPEVLKKSM